MVGMDGKLFGLINIYRTNAFSILIEGALFPSSQYAKEVLLAVVGMEASDGEDFTGTVVVITNH